jgi:tetratricopeptide (TPR) repeat protein
MRKRSFSVLAIMLAAAALASTALAQGGIFSGTVVDDEGNPLDGVTVILEKPDANPPRLEVQTNDNGMFSMLGLGSGQWTMNIEIEGYHPQAVPVRIRQGRNPAFLIDMARIKHPWEIALGESAVEGLDLDAIEAELAAADVSYNNQQWDEALAGYRSILSRLPMMNGLHMQIGAALRGQEQYEEAITSFETALAGDPQLEPLVESAIARIRLMMGDFEAAGSALASVAGNEGASREDFYNLGELEFAKGEVDAAAGWYEKAVAADPDWAPPLFKLALVALNKGDMETAKRFLAQVVEKDPNSAEGAQAQATLNALP